MPFSVILNRSGGIRTHTVRFLRPLSLPDWNTLPKWRGRILSNTSFTLEYYTITINFCQSSVSSNGSIPKFNTLYWSKDSFITKLALFSGSLFVGI